MAKGRAVLSGRLVAGKKPFFIILGGSKRLAGSKLKVE
jgi:hypothetical protein